MYPIGLIIGPQGMFPSNKRYKYVLFLLTLFREDKEQFRPCSNSGQTPRELLVLQTFTIVPQLILINMHKGARQRSCCLKTVSVCAPGRGFLSARSYMQEKKIPFTLGTQNRKSVTSYIKFL